MVNMGMKILIADDEPAIREGLGRRLQRENFIPILAANGSEALRQFYDQQPDLVVLDIVMPELDGMTVCRRIRSVSDIPVMMLSAQAIREQDIIEGLNAGADEYLVKPIRLGEFLARVRALLRRSQYLGEDVKPSDESEGVSYDDGYLNVSANRRLVQIEGQSIHLTPTEFKLLVTLIAHHGEVVPASELLTLVWGPEYADDLYYPRVYVSQLRRKIEIGASPRRYILTEHRIGYRFEGRVNLAQPSQSVPRISQPRADSI